MKRMSLNENDIIIIRTVLDEVRRNGWEKSGLGSMTFEALCKLDSKIDRWVNEKVYDMVWDEFEGWVDRHPVIHDEFNPTYDTDEWM